MTPPINKKISEFSELLTLSANDLFVIVEALSSQTKNIKTSTVDSRYLKLDASNDPITGTLLLQNSADALELIIKAKLSQTANLLEWQNSVGTILGGIDERGILFCAGAAEATNVFIGDNAGKFPNTAVQTVAIGNLALDAVTTGDNNTAIGYNALTADTTGSFNVAMGPDSMRENIDGHDNVGIGNSALRTNSSGDYNMAIGAGAFRLSTTGNFNVGVGTETFRNLGAGGSSNIAFGHQAGYGIGGAFTDTINNVFIGHQAGYSIVTSMSGNIFIGYQAGYSATGSDQLIVSNSNTTTPLIYGLFTGSGAGVRITSQAMDGVPLVVRGILNQASNFQEWQKSTAAVQISFDDNGGAIFNEAGNAAGDFRIESDTEANMLFLDANGDTDGALYLGGTTNGVKIIKGGELTLLGTATVWNDINMSLVTAKVPAANFPAWAAFSANLNSYTFAINDYADISTAEILHQYKEGSDLGIHIHLVTNGLNNATARKVKYTIYYSWGDMDEVMGAEASLTAEATIAANVADRTHLFLDMGDITGENYKIESLLKLRVKRIAGTGTEPAVDPFVEQVGIHYEIDALGSKTELVK
jgi:hypothetical protein